MTRRGALIVLEGLDRVGKSTQCRMLAESLSVPVFVCPDRSSATGRVLDAHLSGVIELHARAAHLLFSANRWEQAPRLLRALRRGATVVLDRYSFSGVAFSAGLPLEWCRQTEVGLPRPDLVLFLHLDVARLADREGFGRDRYETLPRQEAALRNFVALMSLGDGLNWRVVDADADADSLHAEIKSIVLQTMEDVAATPLGKLWES